MVEKFNFVGKANIEPLLTEKQWKEIALILNNKHHFQILRNYSFGKALVYNLVTKEEIISIYNYLDGAKKEPEILSVLRVNGVRQGYELINVGTVEVPDFQEIYNVKDEEGNLLPEIEFPEINWTVFPFKLEEIKNLLPEYKFKDPDTGEVRKVKEPGYDYWGWKKPK